MLVAGFAKALASDPGPTAGRRPLPGWSTAGVGFVAGALTTTTSLNGPALVLWLQRLGASLADLRAAIAAQFLPLNIAGALALAALGGTGQRLPVAVLAVLLVAAAAGHLADGRLFDRLDARRFRLAGVLVVMAAGVASAVAGASGVVA